MSSAKLMAHRGRAILEDARAILTKDGVSEITTRLRHGDLVETVGKEEDAKHDPDRQARRGR
jgi:predicted O-methyltransferase YrrM